MQLLQNYNVGSFKPVPHQITIHSLCANHINTRISIALRGGEIYEISLPTHTKQMLLRSFLYGTSRM